MARWRTKVENELKLDGKNFWIRSRLIRALSYPDALRCSDLLDDGWAAGDAEVESETEFIGDW